MAYKIESLPASVAEVLVRFAAALPADALDTNALAVGQDGTHHYLGLVASEMDPTAVTASAFTTRVREGALQTATVPPDTALERVQVIPGRVVRCLAVAMEERAKEDAPPPLAELMWRMPDDILVAMLVPARDDDAALIGGRSAQGKEVHYHIDTTTFELVRTTGAR